MTIIIRLRAPVVASLAACLMSQLTIEPAKAANPILLYTVNCSSSVHIADFVSCAKTAALVSGAGAYVSFAPTKFTTVILSSCTYVKLPAQLNGNWLCTSAAAQTTTGTPVTTDAGLEAVNTTLMATIQAKKGPTFNINPGIEESYIGSEDALVDSRAVSNAIGNVGGNPAALAVGTVVMVQWSDGTTAQFQKVSNGTLMWALVPGSAKNSKGQPIDANGKVTGNNTNNLGGPGIGGFPNFPGMYMDPSDWTFWDPLPGGTVTVGPACGLGLSTC